MRALITRISCAVGMRNAKLRNHRKGDNEDGNDEDDDLLLKEELEYLDEKLRNEEINDICNQVGVIHPIMYDGYDLCEQVRLDKLSAFTVSTLRTMCKHFELSFRSKDNKPCLMDKGTWYENAAAAILVQQISTIWLKRKYSQQLTELNSVCQ